MKEKFLAVGTPQPIPAFLTPEAYADTITLQQARKAVKKLQRDVNHLERQIADLKKNDTILRQALEEARVRAVEDTQTIKALKSGGGAV